MRVDAQGENSESKPKEAIYIETETKTDVTLLRSQFSPQKNEVHQLKCRAEGQFLPLSVDLLPNNDI